LKLYRQHFGTIPVTVSGETGDLDISAALTADQKALTVAIVNPTAQTETVNLNVIGFKLDKKVIKWTIAGPDPEMYNEPDRPPKLVIKQEQMPLIGDSVNAPAYGILLARLDLIRQ
jgi:alpha-N-arabinofuranosidase